MADKGPVPEDKIGEGSYELIRLLSEEKCTKKDDNGNCIEYKDTSIEKEVLCFVFPSSKIPGLKPVTAQETIQKAALEKFEKFKKSIH